MERLYSDPKFKLSAFGSDVTKAFRKKVFFIENATDERDLYGYTALHYEKLAGDLEGLRSIRLNDQWRLLLEPVDDDAGRLLIIIRIDDYH